MKLGHRLGWMSENMRAPGLPSRFRQIRAAPAAAHLATWRPPGGRRRCIARSIAHPAFDSFWRAIERRRSSSTRSKFRCSRSAAGTTITCESDLEAYRGAAQEVGLEPRPDRAVAAQHVVPFRGRRFRARVLGAGALAATRMVRPVADGQGHAAALAAAGARSSSWAPTSGAKSASGRPKAHAATAFSWRAEAAPTRSTATARWPRARRAQTPRIVTFSIRATPCPRAAARFAAIRRVFPWGPMDQRPVEHRKDVLVYTTAPLKQDLEVIGPVRSGAVRGDHRAETRISRPSWWMCFRTATRAI